LFRVDGITNYMEHGGRLDVAQEWANHADTRITGLYDHGSDKVSLAEVERIRIGGVPIYVFHNIGYS